MFMFTSNYVYEGKIKKFKLNQGSKNKKCRETREQLKSCEVLPDIKAKD